MHPNRIAAIQDAMVEIFDKDREGTLSTINAQLEFQVTLNKRT